MAADLTLCAVPNLPYALEIARVASGVEYLNPATWHVDGAHGPDGSIVHDEFDYTEEQDSDRHWQLQNWMVDWPGYSFFQVAPMRSLNDGPTYDPLTEHRPSIATAFPVFDPTVITRAHVASIMTSINLPGQREFRCRWTFRWNANFHQSKYDPAYVGPTTHTPKPERLLGRRRWARRGHRRVAKPQQVKRWLLAHVGDVVWTETW